MDVGAQPDRGEIVEAETGALVSKRHEWRVRAGGERRAEAALSGDRGEGAR